VCVGPGVCHAPTRTWSLRHNGCSNIFIRIPNSQSPQPLVVSTLDCRPRRRRRRRRRSHPSAGAPARSASLSSPPPPLLSLSISYPITTHRTASAGEWEEGFCAKRRSEFPGHAFLARVSFRLHLSVSQRSAASFVFLNAYA
jgi:hypothetical protein